MPGSRGTLAPQRPVVASVSTYPPRACGLATFTADLAAAYGDLYRGSVATRVVAMHPEPLAELAYPPEVLCRINRDEPGSYLAAAEALNGLPGLALVHVQHEFGIFGGEYGSYLLPLLRKLSAPVLVTFHTVLPNPNPELRSAVRNLADVAAGFVVMTSRARGILVEDYGLAGETIGVIPHGVHAVGHGDPDAAKASLSLPRRTILSSFGLINRGKGIEYVLDALPQVVRQFPDVLYLIIGATHPEVLRREGEDYRNSLERQVFRLGLQGNVRFYNRYLATPELLQLLQASDVYLGTSLDANQAVSGTLAYAQSVGRPVVATRFTAAQECVTPDVGYLVDFRNADQIAAALLELLADQRRRMNLGANAYFRTRAATWPNVALAYQRRYASLAPALAAAQPDLPPVRLSYLAQLTDRFGMVQFAPLGDPDRSSGYTADDNARALQAAARAYARSRNSATLKLMETYLAFLELTAGGPTFSNYFSASRVPDAAPNQAENLDDARGRVLWAAAEVAACDAVPAALRGRAAALAEHQFRTNVAMSSPRAVASTVLGLAAWLGSRGDSTGSLMRELARGAEHLASIYRDSRTDTWHWFEPYLTYSNGTLPEALLAAARCLPERRDEYQAVALETLDFLVAQTFRDGVLVPIGERGWYLRGGTRQTYDQQPEEAAATVQALCVAFRTTGEERYRDAARRAFGWYLGANTLGQMVYNPANGGCFDGLSEASLNLNQGAEAATTYLLARLAVEELG